VSFSHLQGTVETESAPVCTWSALAIAPHSGELNAVSKSNALLEVARQDFPSFYARGTARDKTLMDALVLITALVVRINADRLAMDPGPGRTEMEEMCNAAQRAFSDLRDKVRASPALAGLPMVERWKIESAIFERAP
jgi:hypothetical protein